MWIARSGGLFPTLPLLLLTATATGAVIGRARFLLLLLLLMMLSTTLSPVEEEENAVDVSLSSISILMKSCNNF